MSDESSLLRAVVLSPDDLTVRLIYADWLEEHGRDAHAALIRGQCLLEPVLRASSNPAYDRDPRFLTLQDLTPDLRHIILAPFTAFFESAGIMWQEEESAGYYERQFSWYLVRRGFVEAVSLQGLRLLAAFIPHAAGVLAQVPLQTLNVWRQWGGTDQDPDFVPPELVRRLLNVDGVERLRELNLSNFNLGAAAAQALLTHGERLQLTALVLRQRSLSRKMEDALRKRFGEALNLSSGMSDDDIPF